MSYYFEHEDQDGQRVVIHDGRLSVYGRTSMLTEDAKVAAIGVDVGDKLAAAEPARRRVAELETEIRDLHIELERLADRHHRTLTGSRLHDPEHIDSFRDCPAKTCQAAQAALSPSSDGGTNVD